MRRYVQVGDKWVRVCNDAEAEAMLELAKPEPPPPPPPEPKARRINFKHYRDPIKDRRFGLLAGDQE